MIASGLIASSCARNSSFCLIFGGWMMERFNSSAHCFTGDAVSSIPRPFGRSGWVTTSGTENPVSTNFCKDRTANCGVPQNTIVRDFDIRVYWRFQHKTFKPQRSQRKSAQRTQRGLFPFPSFHQLFDFAFDQVTLERADVADVQLAIQVVGFVEEGTGK